MSSERQYPNEAYLFFFRYEIMMEMKLAGCAILDGGKILLLHRIKRDWYELPGGKIEAGESPESAAVRELGEELLCDVEILQKLGSKEFKEGEKNIHYTWFLARIASGAPKIGEPEKFDRFKYIALDELENYSLSSNMKNFLAEMKSGRIIF